MEWRKPPKRAVSEAALQKYATQMDAIGEWSINKDLEIIEWKTPKALACEIAPFDLAFIVDTESRNIDPDDRMFAMWDRYRPNHHKHIEKFKRLTVDWYRDEDAGPSFDFTWDSKRYPRDLPEDKILKKLVQGGEIAIRRTEFEGELSYALEARFSVAWDEEHGARWLEYDEETDSFTDELETG